MFLQELINLIKGTAGKIGRGGGDGKGVLPTMKFGTRGGKGAKKKTIAQQKVKDMLDKGPPRWVPG
ncbi:hypothetical protein IMZ48_08980 [Candidatus Bathyarchaeota archaeon]|nr:hypothetical protein [Candidatus Bathyarchaeota archaeon]